LAFFASASAATFSGMQTRANAEGQRRSLRAYVGTDTKGFRLQCGSCETGALRPEKGPNPFYKDDFIVIAVRNSGQTPAYDLSVKGSWKELRFGEPLPKDFDYPDVNDPYPDSSMALNPNDTAPAGQTLTPENITMVKRARNHQATIYFYGEINYRDVFGKPRVSPFCRIYDPDIGDQGLSFGACPDHNSPALHDGD
jgi:hypothetical protein